MKETDEAEIRERMQAWGRAVAARDLDRVMSFYAPGDAFLGFDFVPPFSFPDAAAFRAQWAETFAMFDRDPRFELRDLRIHRGGDLAVACGLSRFEGVMRARPIDVWTRQTNVFRRTADRWLMVHEHVSVPIDLATMRGVVDFRP